MLFINMYISSIWRNKSWNQKIISCNSTARSIIVKH